MFTSSMHFRRRDMLVGLGCLAASPALAKAPLSGGQVAGVHRYKIGDIEVSAILDGHFALDTKLMPKATPEAVAEIQRSRFLPVGETIRGAVNTYIVNTGDALVLVDAGARDYFGPTVGKLLNNIAAAGYTPDQIDKIILTHMHPDHIGGVMDADGNAVFPNATLHAHEADWSFWRDPAIKAQAGDDAAFFFDVAVASSNAYEGKAELFKYGQDLGGGISSTDMSGHTPGHSGLLISSGNESLLILGDVVHSAPLQFANPDWSIAFDVDQDAAAAARKQSLDMAATDRLLIAGMHIPFPGVGHVEKRGQGYGFVPAPWQYVLE